MNTHWMSVSDEYSNEYSRPSMLPYYIGKIAIVVDVQQAFFQIEMDENYWDFFHNLVWCFIKQTIISSIMFCKRCFQFNLQLVFIKWNFILVKAYWAVIQFMQEFIQQFSLN